MCRILRDFWNITVMLYIQLPLSFFSDQGPWLRRAHGYRMMPEPVDIVEYYRKGNGRWLRKGERQYLEAKHRPKRFAWIELQWARFHPEADRRNSTLLALFLAERAESQASMPTMPTIAERTAVSLPPKAWHAESPLGSLYGRRPAIVAVGCCRNIPD